MSENAALIPRPYWATHQETTDAETVTNFRELSAWSIGGPAPVALLDTWEVITTLDGTYVHPDGPLLHIGHEAWTQSKPGRCETGSRKPSRFSDKTKALPTVCRECF